jgi:hypothetical protein
MEKRKKEALIDTFNSEWKFLNFELFDSWPLKGIWAPKGFVIDNAKIGRLP